MATLSTQRTAHALRHFTLTGILWAIYGPNATPAAAIFSGFALSQGITEAQVAFLVSLCSLVGLWELAAFPLSRPLLQRRALMTALGCVEITTASAVIVVGLVAAPWRFALMATLLLIAYAIGHTINPGFSSWLSRVLPDDVRGRYIGSRMFAISVASMLYLFLASRWLDWQNKTYGAFAAIFVVGWIAGILGYLLLLVTPYPEDSESERPERLADSLRQALSHRPFTQLTLYFVSYTAASTLAGAFYGVYMINRLHLSYSAIALYSNLTLAMMMLGYLLAGSLSQRYGSKPLTQLLLPPAALVPLLWAFATPQSYHWLLPEACFINGLAISGLGVAASNLLFKLLPREESNRVYFAVWSGALALGAAFGPFVGGLLKDLLPASIVLGPWSFSELQIIFALSAAAHILPLLLTYSLVEGEATSPRYLLGQFRGNLLSLAFGYGLYALARSDETRSEALRLLGRTGSPLALARLVRDLDHMSPEVRKGAVAGLGEGRFPEAAEPLLQELQDKESDVRAEAAEALGKIGASHRLLFEALYDEDPRVRQSAALGLAQLQTLEAREALLQALREHPDRSLFPTLVEAVARGEDLRGIEPALAGLSRFKAPVLRMQIINGVCRILGEKNHFYRLATADELAAGRMRERMMARIRRLLERTRCGTPEMRTALRHWAAAAERALEEDRLEDFAEAASHIAALIEPLAEAPEIARAAARAIRLYLEQERPAEARHELVVFLVVALTSLARHLPQ